MAITLNFDSLVSRFNNGLAHKKRRDLYEVLKSARLLGKVFGKGDQATIRPYLFDTFDSRYWFERPLFETHNLRELEEQRVQRYLDILVGHLPEGDPSYPRARDQKSRQLLSLLREMDDRVELVEMVGEHKELSLAYLPCSWETLRKVRAAFPAARTILDLAGKTEASYKQLGIRNPGAKQVSGYIEGRLAEYRQKNLRPSVAKRLEAAQIAGQTVLF